MSDKNFDEAKINSVFGIAENAEALLNEMKNSCPEYIPTGFSTLDNVLNGGLTASLYVLGAMPSLGKSTFLINMSENIALSKTAVLYFSLEMPADHIARGTFCRCLFNAKKEKKDLSEAKRSTVSVSDLLKASFLDEEKEILDDAFEQYKKIGEYFYVIDKNYINEYNKDESTVTVSLIKKYVEDFINKEKTNVVVIMDYLQLLKPEEDMKRSTDRAIVNNSIDELVNIAHTNKIPVITISSINRASYSEPVTLSSFKESGGIEFSADVVWGLQLKDTGEKNNSEADKAKDYRDMQLVILKNRYGSRDHSVDFEFYTKFGLYTESGNPSEKNQNEEQPAEKEETVIAAAAAASVTAYSKADNSKATDVPAYKSAKEKEKGNSRRKKFLTGYINNTKIANYLRGNRIETGTEYPLTINGSAASATIISFTLTYKGEDKNSENKSLTFMDCAVMDAVLSYYYNLCNNKKLKLPAEFTVRDLIAFMQGRHYKAAVSVSKSMETKITGILEKLKNMEMTIDITQECRIMRGLTNAKLKEKKISCLLPTEGNDSPIILRGSLLPWVYANSQKTKFRIDRKKKPLLYEYSDKINSQIIIYSSVLLAGSEDSGKKSRVTESRFLERYYLIQQIEVLKYMLDKKNKTPKNVLDSQREIVLYDMNEDYSGVIPKVTNPYKGEYSDYLRSDAFRRRKKNISNEINAHLKYFQSKGYIEGYDASDPKEFPVYKITGRVKDSFCIEQDQ